MITCMRACPFTEDVSIRFTWAWAVFEIESRTKQMKRPTRQLSAGFAATVLILLSGHSTLFASMPGDEHWSPEFGWPGTGDIVYSITIHNGRLYASGGSLNGTNATINVWDGEHWSTLGQVNGSSGTAVYDMAFVGNVLYV